MLQSFQAVKARMGLKADTTNTGIEFLQATRRAHERSAGAQTGDKMGDAAARLFPNFWRRSFVMCARVRRIAVLIGIKIFFGLGFVELADPVNRAVGAFVTRRVDDLCSICLQNLFALR